MDLTPVGQVVEAPRRPASPRERKADAICAVICVLVVGLLVRQNLRETASFAEKKYSTILEGRMDSIDLTKSAYLRAFEAGSDAAEKREAGVSADKAVARWKRVVDAAGLQSDWRSLGLARFVLHRPGAAEALAHVATAPLKLSTPAAISPLAPRPRAERVVAARPPVAADAEAAVWKEGIASAELSPNAAARTVAMVKKLQLGWLGDAVLAEIAARNGEPSRGARLASAAAAQVRSGRTALLAMAGVVCIGVIALFFATAAYTVFRITVEHAAPPLFPDRRIASANWLPYGAALLAFAAYLAAPPLLIRPFGPILRHLAGGSIRGYEAVSLAFYVPVAAVTIGTLLAAARWIRPGSQWNLTTVLSAIGFRSRRPLVEPAVAAGFYILITPLFVAASWLSHWLFSQYKTPLHPVDFELFAAHNSLDRLLILLTAAVAAPIIEEIAFRGILFQGLRNRWGRPAAAVISSFIFAILHPTMPAAFLPLFALGIAFCYLFDLRGSLLPGIAMHSIHNLLLTLLIIATGSP